MNINHLEHVTALRNHREKALELRTAAASGTVDFTLFFEGQKLDPFSVISAEPVRQAIIESCTDYIVDLEKELKDLGVTVSAPQPEPVHDEGYWRRNAQMVVRAWQRALGNRLVPKTHLIDALVLTTERAVKNNAD